MLTAIGFGLGRTLRSPGLVLLLWLAVLLFSMPAAVIMEEAIRADIGDSRIHEQLEERLDLGWLAEFQARRGVLATSLTPSTVSSAALFDNLDRWFRGDGIASHRGLAASGILFVVAWILLQGGILDHLTHRGRRLELQRFFSASGAYFARFLRLALLTGLGYYGVYRFSFWLFPEIERLNRDVTVERTVLSWYLLGAAMVTVLLAFVHLVADYAKIATVREQRRSMVLALLRSASRVVRHPLQAFGLYATLTLLLVAAQIAYLLAAPDVGGRGATAVLSAFAVGQVYLLLRWALRVSLYAAELRLYDQWTRRPPS